MPIRRPARLVFRFAAVLLVAGLAALLAVALVPDPIVFTLHHSPPPADFAAARAALESAGGKPALSEHGRPRALLHAGPTDQVFVLLHGLTNVPEQFVPLGRLLFERGHNVVIPLTPGHGNADLMTDELASFRAQAMLDAANEAITAARALGRRLTVVGLSINGTTIAWVAQNRADVDSAVLLAPFLAPRGLPAWAIPPTTRLLVRLPNAFVWWNPMKKENLAGPVAGYPRFSSRSIGETMRLGLDVFAASEQSAPACRSILVVTTASDLAASNARTARLAANWNSHRPGVATCYEFPAAERVPHDLIDPQQPDQQVALVYPRLIEMLEAGRPAGHP